MSPKPPNNEQQQQQQQQQHRLYDAMMMSPINVHPTNKHSSSITPSSSEAQLVYVVSDASAYDKNHHPNHHQSAASGGGGRCRTTTTRLIRKILEPLIMSLITTLIVFHTMYGSLTPIVNQNVQNVLDSPTVAALASTAAAVVGTTATTTTNSNANNILPQQQQDAATAAAVSDADADSIVVKRRFPDPPKFNYHGVLSKTSPMPPIFYHIYIPDNTKGQKNAFRIIKEQIEAFKPTHSKASPQQRNQTVTVYYQTIGGFPKNMARGEEEIVSPTTINGLCLERNMTCIHLGHDDDGREELTLHHAYQFCRDDAGVVDGTELFDRRVATDRRVVYMHNKGSHHKTQLNELWRRKMMQAIQNEKCIKPPMETCSVCSLFTTAERGIFMAGNFWVAKCSYLRQLLPPLEFEGHMERVVKEALYMNLEGSIQMNMHKQWAPSFGVGRYSAELWAGSHPDIMPCDFSWSFQPQTKAKDNTNDFLMWVNQTSVMNKPLTKWTMAPKHPIKIANKNVRTIEKVRLPEYHLLAGNVLRWYELYGKVPGEFSWVWAWFPDGRKWRNAIRQHGRNALKELTKEFRVKDHD